MMTTTTTPTVPTSTSTELPAAGYWAGQIETFRVEFDSRARPERATPPPGARPEAARRVRRVSAMVGAR